MATYKLNSKHGTFGNLDLDRVCKFDEITEDKRVNEVVANWKTKTHGLAELKFLGTDERLKTSVDGS